jgi:hypothetical protein
MTMKLVLYLVAGALVAAVLIAANRGASDHSPAYPSGRHGTGAAASHSIQAAAGSGPRLPGYLAPLTDPVSADAGR